MRRFLPLVLALLGGCAPGVPEACPEMCLEAAALYGGCIEEWGLDWPAVGYEDERAYVHSCETWAWEARLLTRDEPDWLGATCLARRDAFAEPEATCEDYAAVDWSLVGSE